MILVTGGTGHVGEQVVRTLRRFNLPVRALVRKGSHYYWLNDTGCGFFFGDLRDPLSLRRALRGCSHLVVCSGVGLESSDNHHTNVTVDGHGALFEAARNQQIERVVLLSCMGVDRGYKTPAFDARQGAEELLIHSGLDYTILRACVHEHFFLKLAWNVVDNGSARFFGPGTNRLSPIATTDLGMLAAASLDLASVRNQTVPVGGPSEHTPLELFQTACDVVGVEPRHTHIPRAAVGLARSIGRPFRRYAHRVGEKQIWMTEDLVADAAQIQATFGIPLTPLDQALAAANEVVKVMRDPTEREKRMVHPQFYATVYEPGQAKLPDLPSGPPPRQD